MPKARAKQKPKGTAGTPSGPPARRGILLAGCALALATALAYANSFSGPFLFDDAGSLTDNPTIRHLWPIWSAMWAPASAGSAGRPVLNLSFAINYAFGGFNVRGYHAVNVTIHLLAGLALFGIVRRTLLRWSRPTALAGPPVSPGLRSPETLLPSPLLAAFAVALLWALHPLQTESVTYVSERAESLMGLFYLLALYAFIRYAEEGKTGPAVLSLFFYVLGAATKEVMTTAPVVILLYDRTFVSGTFREAWRRRWKYYVALAAPWLLLGLQLARVRDRGVGLGVGGGWWQYALMESRVIVQYLGLTVWPHPLVFDYGRGVDAPTWAAAPYAAGILLLLAATAWALFRPAQPRSAGRVLGFLGAWVFLILAPTSSVVAVSNLPMAEHRMYLPLAAVAVLVVLGAYRWLGARSLPVCLALAAGAGALTVRRNEDYRSALDMWRTTALHQPDNARVQTNLGDALEAAGHPDEALPRFVTAVRLRPDDPEGRLNLGNFLLRQNRPAEAVEPCEAALQLKPNYPEAHYILGMALLRQGQTAAGLEHFEAALKINPDYADAHHTLAGTLAMSGRMDEALVHYETAQRLQPDNPLLYVEMGQVLTRMQRPGEAMVEYQTAERLEPNSTPVQFAIGNALFDLRRFPEAAAHYAAAVRISPGFADAHNNLGNTLAELGRLDEAQAEYETVLRLKPGDELARDNLDLLRKSRGESAGH